MKGRRICFSQQNLRPFLFKDKRNETMITEKNTLCKEERLNSKKSIEMLFSGNAKSFSAFPLRVVFMPVNADRNIPTAILISVPKKRFKRAVKRNRIKRQIRETYRKNKHCLLQLLQEQQNGLLMAFIFMDNELHPSSEIENKLKELLDRISERIKRME